MNIKLSSTNFAAGLILVATSLQAATVTVTLGQSAQNFVENGTGATATSQGTYILNQGSCGYNGTITTCTLSGAFTGTTTGFTSGTYSFITTYAGNVDPITAISELASPDFFNYTNFSATTDMVLDLTPTGGTTDVIPLVTNGTFIDSDFSFLFSGTYTCSGVAVPTCSPYEVGITNGAIGQAPVTTTVSFTADTTPVTTPEPATIALAALSPVLIGALRLRRKRTA